MLGILVPDQAPDPEHPSLRKEIVFTHIPREVEVQKPSKNNYSEFLPAMCTRDSSVTLCCSKPVAPVLDRAVMVAVSGLHLIVLVCILRTGFLELGACAGVGWFLSYDGFGGTITTHSDTVIALFQYPASLCSMPRLEQ